MKKNYLVIALISFLLAGCGPKKNTVTIKGHVQFDQPGEKMQIFRMDGNEKKVVAEFDLDPENNYSHSFTVEKPGLHYLDCKKWERTAFWAEDEDIEINFRGKDTAKMVIKMPLYHPILSSGPKNALIDQYNYLTYRDYCLMVDLSKIAYEASFAEEAQKQLFSSKLYGALSKDLKARIEKLAWDNYQLNSVIALLPLLKGEKYEPLLEKIYAAHPGDTPVLQYKKAREEAELLAQQMQNGKTAPGFSYPVPDGSESLGPENFRGKYLLIDFWASWCGPCRAEIPHLKEYYEKYRGEEVEFLSVSIDAKPEDWKKALAEENLPWPQVLAPEAGKEIVRLYQFSGIPFIILLDKEGKIVEKRLRGAAIDKKLGEVLGRN